MKDSKFDESLLTVYPVEIRVGVGLVRIVQSDRFKNSLNQVRRDLALDFGFLTPPVRVRDNSRLDPDTYDIKVKEWWIAQAKLDPDRLLALNLNGTTSIKGVQAIDPAFGSPGLWIEPELRPEAEELGGRILEPGEVLTSHLTEVLINFAPEFLGRDEVQAMLDRLAKTRPTLARELMERLDLGTIRQVLQSLLDERVPIRDTATIGETLCDLAGRDWELDALVNGARRALRRTITGQYVDQHNSIAVLDLGPELVRRLRANLYHDGFQMSEGLLEQVFQAIQESTGRRIQDDNENIILAPKELRTPLRKLTRELHPEWVFLSPGDIAPEVQVERLETVEIEAETAE